MILSNTLRTLIPKKNIGVANLIVIALVLIVFLAPFTTLAYEPLVNIPGLDAPTGREADIGNLVNALFGIAIAIAAMLAVIKLIIGGVKYMLSDIVTTKGEARNEITSALLGLLLILATTLILSTINSQITGFSILDGKLDVRWKSATPDEPVEGAIFINCTESSYCNDRCPDGTAAGPLTVDPNNTSRLGAYCVADGSASFPEGGVTFTSGQLTELYGFDADKVDFSDTDLTILGQFLSQDISSGQMQSLFGTSGFDFADAVGNEYGEGDFTVTRTENGIAITKN